MSRQNKVNPGTYTQRGRLTQDDAARELARQRVIGSPHSWQPEQRDKLPRLKGSEPAAREGAGDEAAEVPKPAKRPARTAAAVKAEAKPAAKKAAKKAKAPARKG
jgi:hypothetical protein